mmetsp:Transcript_24033/g.43239  ORF Transcript_24033/g.43239 Transcript_24033/m.43239 type:complete len:308 (-) Transcript_24033:54-977(-)
MSSPPNQGITSVNTPMNNANIAIKLQCNPRTPAGIRPTDPSSASPVPSTRFPRSSPPRCELGYARPRRIPPVRASRNVDDERLRRTALRDGASSRELSSRFVPSAVPWMQSSARSPRIAHRSRVRVRIRSFGISSDGSAAATAGAHPLRLARRTSRPPDFRDGDEIRLPREFRRVGRVRIADAEFGGRVLLDASDEGSPRRPRRPVLLGGEELSRFAGRPRRARGGRTSRRKACIFRATRPNVDVAREASDDEASGSWTTWPVGVWKLPRPPDRSFFSECAIRWYKCNFELANVYRDECEMSIDALA